MLPDSAGAHSPFSAWSVEWRAVYYDYRLNQLDDDTVLFLFTLGLSADRLLSLFD